jgi:hypothetical protein
MRIKEWRWRSRVSMTISSERPTRRDAARGPLRVSRANSRYFAIAHEPKAVYLTGSHIWNNLHDGMGPGKECADKLEALDFDAYLDFLEEHGHNFIRLWRWEHFRSQAAGGDFHLCMSPQPWARTGPGSATDVKPKFDLDRFDDKFFERIRGRVVAAGDRGIYVSVMLFEGWALHLSPAPDHVEGHPFHAANNVNAVSIESIVDYQVLPLGRLVQEIQERYIRKLVDTVHDCPNVLWEVANESSGGGKVDPAMAGPLGQAEATDWGDSTEWQYWVIDTVRSHENEMGYEPHPIGMTMQFPVAEQTKVNDPLLTSPAEWISPGFDDEHFAEGGHPMAPGSAQSRWLEDPPIARVDKVIITDTDHYAAGRADALWAWKSFLRGHHPILMDFGLIAGINPPSQSAEDPMSYIAYEAARYAMGDTRRFAERVDLLEMAPREDLSSTRYALANPGKQYLVLQPEGSQEPITVSVVAGVYRVEWFDVRARHTVAAGEASVRKTGPLELRPPFAPALLFLESVTAPGRAI